jgi:hypothetical protein
MKDDLRDRCIGCKKDRRLEGLRELRIQEMREVNLDFKVEIK